MPGAPTGVSAVPGNGQIAVAWTAPASDGGAATTTYTITSNPDANTCSLASPFPASLACTVSGLNNGTPYTFTVTAANLAGASLPSAPSAAVVPATGSLTATIAKTSIGSAATSNVPVTLAWSSSLRSALISRWSLWRQTGGGAATWTPIALSRPTLTSSTASLASGGLTTFRVQPTTKIGATGPWFTSLGLTAGSVQNTDPSIHYAGSGWTTSRTATAYGGSVRYATKSGRTVTVTLTGSSFALVSTMGRAKGKAEVWVDGKRVASLDLYASTTKVRQIVWSIRYATPGAHTVVLKVLGKKNAKATGTQVDLDGMLALK